MNKTTSGVIVGLLMIAAFLVGSSVARMKYGRGGTEEEGKQTPTQPVPTQPPFAPQKSTKPEVKFFVMSFCPYGNQAEAGLEPVYQLLKDKISWQPRYVIYKNYCSSAPTGERAKCEEDYCFKSGAETFCSMHGIQELNQDVREICVFNMGNLSDWWEFVGLVNEKCNSSNVDVCWSKQAETANLNVDKISSCEKAQKLTLAKKEVAEMEKYEATGSPTVFINETLYNGGRTPEDYKKAICLAFEEQPEECNQILGEESPPVNGGCQ